MSRPNVLLFMVDQQRADALGAFGNPVVQTPTIDALADRGVRFDDAWVQHPVCGPSRVSFMTGWYPHVAGHRTLTNLLGPDQPNLLRLLRDHGYRVCMPGHRGDVFAPGVTEASTDLCGFIRPPTVSWTDVSLAHPPGHPMFQAFYFGRQGDEVRFDIDEACIDTAVTWLDDDGPGSEPWAMWVPLLFPHPPFLVEDPWFSLHDRADVPMPLPMDAAKGKPGFMDEYRARYGWDALDEESLREIVATYYGMVSRTDDQLRRVLEAVDRRGDLDDTIVVYCADHGEYLGDYSLVEKWPSSMDPSITRNPLIIAGPGVAEGAACSSLVELIDVVPTIHELAEIEPGYRHFGESLVEVLAEPTRPHRTHAACEGGFHPVDVDLFERSGGIYAAKGDLQHDRPDLVGKAQAIRSSTHTYIYRQCESDELYDRIADPEETTNLIDRQDLAPIRDELRAALLDHLVATSDVIDPHADPRFPEITHGWRTREA